MIRYRLEINDLDVTFEVDPELANAETMAEYNNFFSGKQRRLAVSNNDVVEAVLRMISQRVLARAHREVHDVESMIAEFNWSVPGKGEEGLPKIDGSEGIRLVYFDEADFEPEDFFVRWEILS